MTLPLLLFLLPLQSLCPEERDGRWRRCCPGGWISTNPPVLLAGHRRRRRRRVVVVDAESAATSRRGRRSRPRRVVPPRLLVAFAPRRCRLEFHIPDDVLLNETDGLYLRADQTNTCKASLRKEPNS